jgi:hypothetical protein
LTDHFIAQRREVLLAVATRTNHNHMNPIADTPLDPAFWLRPRVLIGRPVLRRHKVSLEVATRCSFFAALALTPPPQGKSNIPCPARDFGYSARVSALFSIS